MTVGCGHGMAPGGDLIAAFWTQDRLLRESTRSAQVVDAPAFGPLAQEDPAQLATCTPVAQPDMRLEVSRANATVVVNWPIEGRAACTAWPRE
jgi:transposase